MQPTKNNIPYTILPVTSFSVKYNKTDKPQSEHEI